MYEQSAFQIGGIKKLARIHNCCGGCSVINESNARTPDDFKRIFGSHDNEPEYHTPYQYRVDVTDCSGAADIIFTKSCSLEIIDELALFTGDNYGIAFNVIYEGIQTELSANTPCDDVTEILTFQIGNHTIQTRKRYRNGNTVDNREYFNPLFEFTVTLDGNLVYTDCDGDPRARYTDYHPYYPFANQAHYIIKRGGMVYYYPRVHPDPEKNKQLYVCSFESSDVPIRCSYSITSSADDAKIRFKPHYVNIWKPDKFWDLPIYYRYLAPPTITPTNFDAIYMRGYQTSLSARGCSYPSVNPLIEEGLFQAQSPSLKMNFGGLIAYNPFNYSGLESQNLLAVFGSEYDIEFADSTSALVFSGAAGGIDGVFETPSGYWKYCKYAHLSDLTLTVEKGIVAPSLASEISPGASLTVSFSWNYTRSIGNRFSPASARVANIEITSNPKYGRCVVNTSYYPYSFVYTNTNNSSVMDSFEYELTDTLGAKSRGICRVVLTENEGSKIIEDPSEDGDDWDVVAIVRGNLDYSDRVNRDNKNAPNSFPLFATYVHDGNFLKLSDLYGKRATFCRELYARQSNNEIVYDIPKTVDEREQDGYYFEFSAFTHPVNCLNHAISYIRSDDAKEIDYLIAYVTEKEYAGSEFRPNIGENGSFVEVWNIIGNFNVVLNPNYQGADYHYSSCQSPNSKGNALWEGSCTFNYNDYDTRQVESYTDSISIDRMIENGICEALDYRATGYYDNRNVARICNSLTIVYTDGTSQTYTRRS